LRGAERFVDDTVAAILRCVLLLAVLFPQGRAALSPLAGFWPVLVSA
jgi:hypothetical protein